MRCDLANHPKACVITQSRYRRLECAGCTTGEKHLAAAAPDAPETIPTKSEPTPRYEKETPVDHEAAKEAILRVLKRKGAMTSSLLKNYAACKTTKEFFQAALDELVKAGQIHAKPGQREGSITIWLSGSPEPSDKKAAAPSNKSTVPSKRTRAVNRTPAPGNGSSSIGATIAALEQRKADLVAKAVRIDGLIEELKGTLA